MIVTPGVNVIDFFLYFLYLIWLKIGHRKVLKYYFVPESVMKIKSFIIVTPSVYFIDFFLHFCKYLTRLKTCKGKAL